jgi:NADPH-dependent 2,4-dienoyl-CoA reductase/sulfur reductase-like enzyme
MSRNSDFFGDVFDDPNDDPLLGGEQSSTGEATEQVQPKGQPSWMSEGEEYSNGVTSPSTADHNDVCRKQVVVDQRRGKAEGIDALNRAVGDGWRLVRLSLDRPNGEQAASRTAAHRFVAVLEQEEPRSLFDFDPA